MTRATGPRPGPAPAVERADAEHRRRAGRAAAATWMGLTLAAIVGLGGMVLWHLVRRGRLIRDRLGPPRDARLPDDEGLEARGGAGPSAR